MCAREIIKEYFKNWKICRHSTYGRDKAILVLRDGETRIQVEIDMNGGTHWTSNEARIVNIVAIEEELIYNKWVVNDDKV